MSCKVASEFSFINISLIKLPSTSNKNSLSLFVIFNILFLLVSYILNDTDAPAILLDSTVTITSINTSCPSKTLLSISKTSLFFLT